MKTILVPIEHGEISQTVMESALIVARRFGSYVEGFCSQRPLSELLKSAGQGVYRNPSRIDRIHEKERQRAKHARQHFEVFMKERNVPWSDGMKVADHPTAGWDDREAEGYKAIGEHARLFDLIVIENDTLSLRTVLFDSDRLMHVRSELPILQSVLFESGRPILLSPPTSPQTLGDTIAISWNCSLEAARSTTFAMPFLKAAKKVVLITVDDGMVPGPSGAEALQHLRRNGIDATIMEVQRGKRSVGEAILETAAEAGADLLVKSAYTRSRARQFIFGGGTSHVLMEAHIPVLMAH